METDSQMAFDSKLSLERTAQEVVNGTPLSPATQERFEKLLVDIESNIRIAMDDEPCNTSRTIKVVLDIPPRKQWKNGHGYCGETSIQAIGLYYGSWVSQHIVRQIFGGEVLIGFGTDKRTLKTLLFTYNEWNYNKEKQPHYKQYCVWLKQNLIKKHPCITTVYLKDDDDDKDYDHIMPVIGIEYQTKDAYDGNDVLYFHNLFDNRVIQRRLDAMGSTRKSCKKDLYEGGCIPKDVAYGLAVTGIIDNDHSTLPVRLSVNSWDEPNISRGAKTKLLQGTVVVSNLRPNQKYVLLRYDDYKVVPTSGNESKFLNSKYDYRYDFQANGDTWTFNDPNDIPSNGTIYYRCVKFV
ncbi:unnamed protein product [Didymodactylos carnosus]|uniref:Uncharacterized protein n=1 Tax=Didymodactylos carnosus TaxID=1234261 RepID=A0A814SLA2_9BILA|nr:unnamed protein product [Didymodactylos carnosus]CAF3912512.1 unnamed protein product [Didymodactylos carnosus]